MSVPDPSTTDWVPLWDTGSVGGGGAGSIPGELKVWPGATLPAAKYGKWVWADGSSYSSATYPEASAAIDPAWKTFAGAANPGGGQFRVPDMRGATPCGMDAMPGGASANRVTRAAADLIAGYSGEEYHTLSTAETPAHAHTAGSLAVNSHAHAPGTGTESVWHQHYSDMGAHVHNVTTTGGDRIHTDTVQIADRNAGQWGNQGSIIWGTGVAGWSGNQNVLHVHSITAEAPGVNGTTENAGGGGAHENLQPTVFVPWIVRLDG